MDPVLELEHAFAPAGAGATLRQLRRAGEALRARLVAGPRVVAVRSFEIATTPCPTRFAFGGAALSPAPWVSLTHRAVLVQVLAAGELRTILFGALDAAAIEATYGRLVDRVGDRLGGLVGRAHLALEERLAEVGIAPEDVDLVIPEGLAGHDLRGLLGTEDRAARFPRAKVLVPEAGFADADDVHPLRRALHVRETKLGVRRDRLVETTRDLWLGDGALLVRTPGREPGAQSLVLATGEGVWCVSGNGHAVDAWSPRESKVPGVAPAAQRLDVDVLVAGSPLDAARCYASMMLERTVADRVARAPGFVRIFPTSEVTPSLLAPGLSPTVQHEQRAAGALVRPRRGDPA